MKHATQAQKQRGFRAHALAFLPTIALLIAVNLLTGWPYWSVWVLLAWGIGLFSHWFFVLGPGAGSTRAI